MLRSLRAAAALLATAPLLLLAACGSGPGASADDADKLDVVVAFYPFEFITSRVAGSHAEITDLTKPGAEPHDLELNPRQVAAVSDADLVVYEKGFQAAVDKAITDTSTENAFDTTTVVPLQPLDDGTDHDHADDEHADDHAEDEGAAEAAGLDPHVWLDPANMVTITKAVAEKLAAADPDHADEYSANAADLEKQLTGLGDDFESGLQTCQRKDFITTHAAFGYLARRYGLEQVGINGVSPDAEPSPARIAEIQQIATEHHVTTIFYETLVSPDVAKSIADDLGLTTDVLDPIEGITADSKGQDYVAVMKANLTALQKANGCS